MELVVEVEEVGDAGGVRASGKGLFIIGVWQMRKIKRWTR